MQRYEHIANLWRLLSELPLNRTESRRDIRNQIVLASNAPPQQYRVQTLRPGL